VSGAIERKQQEQLNGSVRRHYTEVSGATEWKQQEQLNRSVRRHYTEGSGTIEWKQQELMVDIKLKVIFNLPDK
jgi:hypothetical protein